jgi:FixJ family two-component response regulator
MSKSTVFVIDDHQSVLDAVAALLEVSGYQAKCFPRQEAFFKQRSMPKEGCILADLTAPEASARQFMRRLRANGCMLPVISASFSTSAELARELQRIGVFAVLKKPFDASDFLEAVQQAMNLSLYALMCGAFSCAAAQA